jgi:lycopene cyclase domain-containing protein
LIHSTRYLLFELVWALPVIALQWAVGWRYLLRTWRLWLSALLGLTIYFTLADAVAIEQGIWRFDETALIGVQLGNVPIEETLFYLVTGAMIVQGMVLGWFFLADRPAFIRSAVPWLARRQAWFRAETSQSQESGLGSRCEDEDEIPA